MQLLGFREPSGRVFILDEIHALPPLTEGYEWTMVVQTEPTERHAQTTQAPAQAPAQATVPNVAPAPAQTPGFFDIAVQILTPRPGQTPKERGAELIGLLPADLREQLSLLVRAVMPPSLPPFPRG